MGRILLAVDDSEGSQRAAEFVARFFSPQEHDVTAVNVARSLSAAMPDVPFGGVGAWPWVPSGPTDPAVARQLLADEAAVAEAMAVDVAPPGAHVEVVFGHPVDAITRAADEVDADVIVVGTNEPGWIERLLGGSVSASLARHAHRPVLVVH
jgi:nucleotide-binding universal stress UspA family protein